jgi:probable F420-dependent oxidoreductase
VRFLYNYPESSAAHGGLLDAASVTALAIAAEAAGWGGLAFTEHPAPAARWMDAGGHETLDPFVALGYAAASTTDLRLLTYLAVAPYRNPSLLAKSAATVDLLSDGRFILGLGTGYIRSEFFALGVDFEERNALVDEALDVLPMHWSGQPFSYKGRHFEARDIIGRPRPVQQPIPIWIGGNAKVTLRRIAERAQGWMPLIGSPELSATTRTPYLATTKDVADKVAAILEMAGDRADAIDVAPSYGDLITQPVTSDVERHREAFGMLEAAGSTWMVVLPPPARTTSEAVEFLVAFGAAYIDG